MLPFPSGHRNFGEDSYGQIGRSSSMMQACATVPQCEQACAAPSIAFWIALPHPRMLIWYLVVIWAALQNDVCSAVCGMCMVAGGFNVNGGGRTFCVAYEDPTERTFHWGCLGMVRTIIRNCPLACPCFDFCRARALSLVRFVSQLAVICAFSQTHHKHMPHDTTYVLPCLRALKMCVYGQKGTKTLATGMLKASTSQIRLFLASSPLTRMIGRMVQCGCSLDRTS